MHAEGHWFSPQHLQVKLGETLFCNLGELLPARPEEDIPELPGPVRLLHIRHLSIAWLTCSVRQMARHFLTYSSLVTEHSVAIKVHISTKPHISTAVYVEDSHNLSS